MVDWHQTPHPHCESCPTLAAATFESAGRRHHRTSSDGQHITFDAEAAHTFWVMRANCHGSDGVATPINRGPAVTAMSRDETSRSAVASATTILANRIVARAISGAVHRFDLIKGDFR